MEYKIIKLLKDRNEEIINLNNSQIPKFKQKILLLCGDTIYDTIDGYLDDPDSNDIIKLIINDKLDITGIFIGNIESDNDITYMESSYTCSRPGGARGELLRYYALLEAHKQNNNIQSIRGSLSGGIPAKQDTDSIIVLQRKEEALLNYHIKRGATINEDSYNRYYFKYSIKQVTDNVSDILHKTLKRNSIKTYSAC